MKLHYKAVSDRLNADTALSGKGHDSAIVDAGGLPVRATYWILFGGGPDELGDDRLTAVQQLDSETTYVYEVRCVAPTADGVRDAAAKVLAQLIAFVPTIAGRRCEPMRYLPEQSKVIPEPDFAIKPPLYWAEFVFALKSDRA